MDDKRKFYPLHETSTKKDVKLCDNFLANDAYLTSEVNEKKYMVQKLMGTNPCNQKGTNSKTSSSLHEIPDVTSNTYIYSEAQEDYQFESITPSHDNEEELIPQMEENTIGKESTQENLRSIRCSNINCMTVLNYPLGSMLVKCPICGVVTSTTPMDKIQCGKCYTELMYPPGAKYIRCVCGAINVTPYG